MARTIVICAVLAAACTASIDPTTLKEREWRLSWIDGFASLPGNVATPTIRFGSDGRLSANTGCNSAGSTYTIDGDRLTLGPVMSTKRACAEPLGNDLERAFVGALERAARVRVTDGQLELVDENGRAVMRFV